MDAYVPEAISGYMIFSVTVASIVLAVAALIVEVLFGFFVSKTIDLRAPALFSIWAKLFAFTFPIATTAYIAGYLSTMSRTTAIGAVLPAALTLIGGLNIYVFGADNKHRVLISYCVCVFAFMLFYGSQSGAYLRESSREYRLRQLAAQELRIKILRRNLGLQEDFPSWIILSEPK
jgi:hypothetical protein